MQKSDTAFSDRNRTELGSAYDRLRFITPDRCVTARAEREALLTGLTPDCLGSKPRYGALSPGCRACAAGTWSCLFVSNLCPAGCFFCPAPQTDAGQPGTNTLSFTDPDEYADYVDLTGMTGVSFSGGEPLLVPERTFAFLEKIRARCRPDLYTWVYTNGLAVTEEAMARLAGMGLDEIRINLHACGYDPKPVRTAVRHIPRVTVEIPAVPEEEARLSRLLPVLSDLGVQHLNLHQLRVTRHNVSRILGRSYTCLHGAHVTVLESEQTALRLAGRAAAAGLTMAVNYCSFIYKHRFQSRAARVRAARLIGTPYESVSPSGYLRWIQVAGTPERIAQLDTALKNAPVPHDSWTVATDGRSARVHPRTLTETDTEGLAMTMAWDQARLRETVSYKYRFTYITLPGGRNLVAERVPVAGPVTVPPELIRTWLRTINSADGSLPLTDVRPYERMPEGLAEYL